MARLPPLGANPGAALSSSSSGGGAGGVAQGGMVGVAGGVANEATGGSPWGDYLTSVATGADVADAAGGLGEGKNWDNNWGTWAHEQTNENANQYWENYGANAYQQALNTGANANQGFYQLATQSLGQGNQTAQALSNAAGNYAQQQQAYG